jgi:hypothetical protein
MAEQPKKSGQISLRALIAMTETDFPDDIDGMEAAYWEIMGED